MGYDLRIDVTQQMLGVPSNMIKSVSKLYAREVAKIARRLVPVRTGDLKRSIKAVGSEVIAGMDYAGYVEYGTRFMNAQPYLRPAMERANLQKIVDSEMKKFLTKQRRVARKEAEQALVQDVASKSEQIESLLESLVDDVKSRRTLEIAIKGLLRTWGAI